MSLGIYPVFNPRLPAAKLNALGEVLVLESDTLDRIADRQGLARLTRFCDNRPVPEGFDGPPDELDEALGEWDEWFDPAEGISAFTALAEFIRSKPSQVQRLKHPKSVVTELLELVRFLKSQGTRKVRFVWN